VILNNISPICTGDTTNTCDRHLAGAAPHSAFCDAQFSSIPDSRVKRRGKKGRRKRKRREKKEVKTNHKKMSE
jgi:hypothetical protein